MSPAEQPVAPQPVQAGPNPNPAAAISGKFLVAANLAPIAGAVFLDWEVFPILFLYWLENLIVGAINLVRMACAPVPAGARAAKLFLMPFFTVHYGIFCLVHGAFLLFLFAPNNGSGPLSSHRPTMDPPNVQNLLDYLHQYSLAWAVALLALSHLVSFILHDLRGSRSTHKSLPQIMAAPYGRIVVLHLGILFGGFLIMLLGSPLPALLILILLKTTLDLRSHRRSIHGKPARTAQFHPPIQSIPKAPQYSTKTQSNPPE